MVQKERKSGHWQVERLQFLKREQRGLRLRYAVIDLQPFDLQTAKFSCLLHHKGAPILRIKPFFFGEKKTDYLSLPTCERDMRSLTGKVLSLGRSSQVPAGVPRNREKLPLSTPKNESNLTRNWDFCEKMWHLSHPRTAILLYELADPQGSRSKGRIAVSE